MWGGGVGGGEREEGDLKVEDAALTRGVDGGKVAIDLNHKGAALKYGVLRAYGDHLGLKGARGEGQ